LGLADPERRTEGVVIAGPPAVLRRRHSVCDGVACGRAGGMCCRAGRGRC